MKKRCIILIILGIAFFTIFKVKLRSAEDVKADKYDLAIEYINEKRYPQAIGLLRELEGYKQTEDFLDQLHYLIGGSYIANGIWAVGAITEDRKVEVVYSGNNNVYAATNSWKNIKSISFLGGDSIEGLTAEGKIISSNTVTAEELMKSTVNSVYAMAEVVKAVNSWKDIKSFQTHYPMSAVAVDNQGFAYVSNPSFEDGKQKLTGWVNIIEIVDARSYVAGLREDGTVLTKDYEYTGVLDTSKWKDIVAISADKSLIGLKEDGTVVATGLNKHGEGDVSEWKDIIAISTCWNHTLGLKRDGSVVSVGYSSFGATEVNQWSDIVAIQAGTYFSIGLKADGTMVLVGDSSSSGAKTPDVSKMKHLYVPQIMIKS